MRDVELAKELLGNKSVSLVIVRGGQTLFESGSSGIYGLLQAIEKLKKEMYGSSVADRVVGRAAALLLAYSHVNEVYAVILSREGLGVLQKNGIKVEYLDLVQKILDRMRKSICPFEKFSSEIKSPNQAYELLKDFAENPENYRLSGQE
jgi:hypothetical protein